MKPRAEIVAATTQSFEQGDDVPAVGDWYMVRLPKKVRRLMCVRAVGSNYVKFDERRLSYADFFRRARRAKPGEAEAIIQKKLEYHQNEIKRISTRIQEVMRRLSVTPAVGSLQSHPEGQAMALALTTMPVEDYKASLKHARDVDLPALHKEVKANAEAMAAWAQAIVKPFMARMDDAGTLKKHIDSRLFAVSLYAGLKEHIHQVVEGEPAPYEAKVHVMQRLMYMDEESLLHYEAGGMTFANLDGFDTWIAEQKNRDRLLPFPRSIVAFRVRRYNRQWKFSGAPLDFLAQIFSYMNEENTNKFTFLYVRNGDNVYRVATEIDFGDRLFPDLRHQGEPQEKLFGRIDWGDVAEMVTEAKKVEAEAKPWNTHRYQPFEPSSLYYDDMVSYLKARDEEHRRVVIVLQGLLDRSEVFAPHPQVSLWTDGGFQQMIELVYDVDKVLYDGPKPDFEAYKAELQKSIKKGSVVAGHFAFWDDEQPRDQRGHRLSGDQGPPKAALVRSIVTREGEKCAVIRWTEQPKSWKLQDRGVRVPRSLTVPISRLFHLSAYEPGTMKKFFADPRAREEYASSAWCFFSGEAFKAGKLFVPGLDPNCDDQGVPIEEARLWKALMKNLDEGSAFYNKLVANVKALRAEDVVRVAGYEVKDKSLDKKTVFQHLYGDVIEPGRRWYVLGPSLQQERTVRLVGQHEREMARNAGNSYYYMRILDIPVRLLELAEP